ncbi:A24 family peptidase [Brevibacillus reuszeri]|uniref:A24 family peptidase n=1 Tax=Brevibacillus reuszeri TaxID=54915 RepID=UPI0028972EED|nr:A24 family peptidase [Brevibacillus reuszeri]
MMSVVVFTVLAVAAWFDLRRRKVPNAITFPVLAAGLFFQWYSGSMTVALAGVAGAFLLTLGPVVLKGMGMGDQKLLMSVGAWSSWNEVYPLFFNSIWLCLLFLLLYPRSWTRLRDNLRVIAIGWSAHRQLWLPGLDRTALSFPYAVFLLGAFLFQHFSSYVWTS